jgi:SAM-dependent methyltransferase
LADSAAYKQSGELGVPSLVWRAGQDRRFQMIEAAADGRLEGGWIIDVGCGVGLYLRAFQHFSSHVFGVELESARAGQAAAYGYVAQSTGEALAFASQTFDLILSHEVIEHVVDDRMCVREMVRALKVGGRLVLFCPNRLYPFETHGHYWRGRYHFGNTPLINYLPDALRRRLASHVRAYRRGDVHRLFEGLPVHIVQHTQIYPGYDNLVYSRPRLGSLLRGVTYALERTPLRLFGISHLVVVEKDAAV